MKTIWILFLLGFLLGSIFMYFYRPSPTIQNDCVPFTLNGDSAQIDIARKNNFIKTNKAFDNTALLLFSAPTDTLRVSNYVRNYKNNFKGGTFAFTILGGDIADFAKMQNFRGIRVYLGLRTAGDPKSGTVVITGVNDQDGDMFLSDAQGRAMAIDQASPCPTDCPYRRTETSPTRRMLGKMPSDPQ